MSKTSIEWTDETKACAHCDRVLPLVAFARDNSRADGLTYWCRDCRNERARQGYQPKLVKGPFGPAPAQPRDGDKVQARKRINHLIDVGKLADPNTLPCTDCGHIVADITKRHEYDHYLGYGVEHHMDVQAVCSACHHKRESSRVRQD